MSELNRREFLLATGVAAVSLMSLPVLQNSAHAAAPTMPDKPVDVGLLSSFDKDGVTQKFAKKPNYFFIVRQDGKLFACLSQCTHRYRPLTVKDTEFYCPAHKSEFSFEGTVTHGPAEDSLPRYAISVDASGHVMVDCSKEFSEKNWDDPASFVPIKPA
jgi:nitrite reductase/ring-hydroxylating ferredoxin subunit